MEQSTSWEVVAAEVNASGTYYEALGLSPEVQPEALQAAYRNRMLMLHPDRSGTQKSADAFAKVSEAYRYLSNADDRRMYDTQYLPKRSFPGNTTEQSQEIAKRMHAAKVLAALVAVTHAPPTVRLQPSSVRAGPTPTVPTNRCCNPSCQNVVEYCGSTCDSCVSQSFEFTKQGRCSRLGCLNPVSGINAECLKCVSRPRKCNTFGCLRMTTCTSGLCQQHQS